MSTKKLNHQKVIECKHCGYDANPPTSKYCQNCGEPLTKSYSKTMIKTAKPKVVLPVEGWLSASLLQWLGLTLVLPLLVFGGASYFFLRNTRIPNLSSNTEINSSISNNSTSSSPNIKLYNSIKEVPNVPEGTFSYGGAILFASITAQGAHKAMTQAHPNFRLLYTESRDGKPGHSKGISMVIDGDLSFAQIAAPLKDAEYNKAKERSLTLEQVPVAIDTIVFFTHPGVSIPGLSIDQLQDIYKGKLTNWKQVGGPDLPIVPFARDPKVANLLNVLLESEVKQVSSKVQYVRDYTESIRKVTSTPGAISFGGSGPLVGQGSIRPLAIAKSTSESTSEEYVQPFINNGKRLNTSAILDGSYPITRRLFILIRRDGKIDEQAGVAYTNMLLSKEGQQFVEKAGFLPLR